MLSDGAKPVMAQTAAHSPLCLSRIHLVYPAALLELRYVLARQSDPTPTDGQTKAVWFVHWQSEHS